MIPGIPHVIYTSDCGFPTQGFPAQCLPHSRTLLHTRVKCLLMLFDFNKKRESPHISVRLRNIKLHENVFVLEFSNADNHGEANRSVFATPKIDHT
jgi:hypothetical protein